MFTKWVVLYWNFNAGNLKWMKVRRQQHQEIIVYSPILYFYIYIYFKTLASFMKVFIFPSSLPLWRSLSFRPVFLYEGLYLSIQSSWCLLNAFLFPFLGFWFLTSFRFPCSGSFSFPIPFSFPCHSVLSFSFPDSVAFFAFENPACFSSLLFRQHTHLSGSLCSSMCIFAAFFQISDFLLVFCRFLSPSMHFPFPVYIESLARDLFLFHLSAAVCYSVLPSISRWWS